MEKQLATRQPNIKTTESKSWFTILKKTLIKYDFSNINWVKPIFSHKIQLTEDYMLFV
jgi:hypothetical protein